MPNNLRSRQILWNGATTGAGGESSIANMNGMKYATIFIEVSAATTISLEVSPGLVGATNTPNTPGRNEVAGLTDANFYPLYEDDMSAPVAITFAGAGKAAIDLSPAAYPYFRVASTNSVTATVVVTGIN